MNDHDYQVVQMMERYGGSFVQALAVAFQRADHFNFQRLKNAFPEYWNEYTNFLKTKNEL